MIDPEFRDIGWQVTRPHGPPTRFQVFGERSSGTNFIKRLLGRNSPLKPVEDFGWKHGFPLMTAIPKDLAVVCTLRDARSWALSMHAKPWHCPPAMQAMDFADFIRAPWRTVADRKRYFPQVAEHGGLGQPLQHDRHPITGQAFPNLLTLRRAKLQGLLSHHRRGCTVVLCRLESVQAAPEAFLDAVHAGLGLPPRDGDLRPVHKRLGSKFQPAVETRPDTPKALSDPDLAFLRQTLDLATEARLGYDYV